MNELRGKDGSRLAVCFHAHPFFESTPTRDCTAVSLRTRRRSRTPALACLDWRPSLEFEQTCKKPPCVEPQSIWFLTSLLKLSSILHLQRHNVYSIINMARGIHSLVANRDSFLSLPIRRWEQGNIIESSKR